ncbi:hypothetical protein ACHAPT_011122 [Fusarium lateritium]
MGQPGEASDTVVPSTEPTKDAIVLPNAFTIRRQDDSNTKFNIRGDSGSSPLSISCDYNFSRGSMDWDAEEATLVLFSGQGQGARRLATIKHHGGYASATLHNSTGPAEFLINYRAQGDQKPMHDLSVPKLGDFEWRKGDSGWELVRVGEPGEVLATGALNVGSDKPPRFALTERGSADDFGEQWRLVAIVSYLRVWDRMRLAFGNPEGDEAAMITTACCLCVVL